MLCVGLLGSAAAATLRPHPAVVGVALGILAVCLVGVVVHTLRRASRKIDEIVAEELDSGADIASPGTQHTLRKTA